MIAVSLEMSDEPQIWILIMIGKSWEGLTNRESVYHLLTLLFNIVIDSFDKAEASYLTVKFSHQVGE